MKTSTAILISGSLVGAALLYRFLQSRGSTTTLPSYTPAPQTPADKPKITLPVIDKPILPDVTILPVKTQPVYTQPVEPVYDQPVQPPHYYKPRIETGRELMPPMLYGAN